MTAATSGTLGPETRTMPTPPRPGGVAAATMVSVRVMLVGRAKATAEDARKGSGALVRGAGRAARSGSSRRRGRLDAAGYVSLVGGRHPRVVPPASLHD